MSRHVISNAKLHLICILGLGCGALLALAACAAAQGPKPFRVETNEVLVPVFVWDQRLSDDAWRKASNPFETDPRLFQDLPILGLAAQDFRVFEDGKQQNIQRVTPEGPTVSRVRDTVGEHYEYATSTGRWIYPDVPDMPDTGYNYHVNAWPSYLLSYTPPDSPQGSCHEVTVTANLPDTEVFSLTQYCRTKFSPSDPLIGTNLGKKMEADLVPAKSGKISLAVNAVVLFGHENDARVHISAEFDSNALVYKLEGPYQILHETIGFLAQLYSTNGSVASRFSDFDCCDYSNGAGIDWLIVGNPKNVDILYAPSGYERQISLRPGKYYLVAAVSDSKKFGRVDMPLTVDPNGGRQFAISSIALAKRTRVARNKPDDDSVQVAKRYQPLISKGAEYALTADTRFRKGEQFFFYFELCEPQVTATQAPTIHANLRVVNTKTNKVEIERLNFDVSSYVVPGNPIIPIGDGIDIRNLPPGNYRLEVQASDSNGQSTPWHSAAFSIQ